MKLYFKNYINLMLWLPIVLVINQSLYAQHSHDDHAHDHSDSSHDSHNHRDDHADHGNGGHDHDNGEASVTVVTQYMDASELFMEHPSLVKGRSARLIVHLTRLSDFTPITKGRLEVKLISPFGEKYTVTSNAPARDGIFLPEIVPPFNGDSLMELKLVSEQLEVTHVIPNVVIYADEHDVPPAEEEKENPNMISFLKEQQWKIDYATVAAEDRKVSKSISASGEIVIPSDGRFVVSAPFAGIVEMIEEVDLNRGDYLTDGQVLFTIRPNSSSSDGLVKLQKDYLLARVEFQKVKKLHESNAASLERLEIARIELETLVRSIENLGLKPEELMSSLSGIKVISPTSGVLEEIFFAQGQQVEEGQRLASMHNDSFVLLRVKVPTSRLMQVGEVDDAIFQPLGSSDIFKISDLSGVRTSGAIIKDSHTGFSVLSFLIPNDEHQFFEGIKGPVELLTKVEKPSIAVPVSAVREEDGFPVIYVQVDGETVERRIPKLGNSDGQWIEVINGIEVGERVVTEGATFIRLSTMSSDEMGHGHAH
ncbi:MAG: efflux RND transporter periplasmic adaptor subunit [Opitutales bacterium]|nr:efflux RND transporter periplasmic adaptor subunit [Opitutales bacterium]